MYAPPVSVTSCASECSELSQPRDVRDAGGDGDQLRGRGEALGQGLGHVVVQVDEVRRAAGDGHLVAQPSRAICACV
jgi:hypothetical protein